MFPTTGLHEVYLVASNLASPPVLADDVRDIQRQAFLDKLSLVTGTKHLTETERCGDRSRVHTEVWLDTGIVKKSRCR